MGGTLPAAISYKDEWVLAFSDIHPQAPVHHVIIPKHHIPSMLEVSEEHHGVLVKMVEAAKHLAKQHGIDKTGFRLVNNCGGEGGQTVFHLHFHLLGGRSMQWPPG